MKEEEEEAWECGIQIIKTFGERLLLICTRIINDLKS